MGKVASAVAVSLFILSAGLASAASRSGGTTGGQGQPSVFTTLMNMLMGNSILGPDQTGQPNQTCGSDTAPNTPGNAVTAPGSAFNPKGTAGMVYAGQQTQNSKNPVSVSQYDVACSHVP
jgi:hypothetical protein